MPKFNKTVKETERRNTYLNLTDDSGQTFGHLFQNNKLLVLTEDDKRYNASINTSGTQITLRRWFDGESVYAGDKLEIQFDPTAKDIDGRTPLKIVVLERSELADTKVNMAQPTIQDEEEERIAEINMQMENELENFLVDNLSLIDRDLKLYKDEQGKSGRQFSTEVGDIDLLCKKRNDFVIIELKKGRSSDKVVGQISRYIGWVKEKLANGNNVIGIIIVHDYDQKLKYAVLANPSIDLKYYKISIDFVTEDTIIKKTTTN